MVTRWSQGLYKKINDVITSTLFYKNSKSHINLEFRVILFLIVEKRRHHKTRKIHKNKKHRNFVTTSILLFIRIIKYFFRKKCWC